MKSTQPRSPSQMWVGRTFVNPVFDYLLIGGGLSLLLVAWIVYLGADQKFLRRFTDPGNLAWFFLLSNAAHFAASTVRLYTKPGTYRSMPFLTYSFPVVCLLVLTVCIAIPGDIGRHLFALYLTWSPYHYAAQAYGLSVMYCYRSGCILNNFDKRLVYWTCLIPFFYNCLSTESAGLRWLLRFVSIEVNNNYAMVAQAVILLRILVVIAPVALFFWVMRSKSGTMPLISILLVVTNSVWWFVFPIHQAFIWATIFHGLQYLAIVIIFHLRDQMAREDNRFPAAFHAIAFYAMCVPLGYAMFQCLPWFYLWSGFGMVESVLLVTAVINIHHFVVDAYIWRLKSSDPNRRIVDA